MKHNYLYVALLALLSFSCNNIEQYRQPVADLTSSWQLNTEQVGVFVDRLQIAQKNAAGMILKMRVPENVDLGDKGRQQAETFIASAHDQFSNFETLNESVAEFMDEWAEKSDDLADLQEGLEAGDVTGDIPAQVNTLKETLGDAEQRLKIWGTDLEATTQGIKSAYESFMNLLPKSEVAQ